MGVEAALVDGIADRSVVEGPSVLALTVGGVAWLDGDWEDFSFTRSSIEFFWLELFPSLSMRGHL